MSYSKLQQRNAADQTQVDLRNAPIFGGSRTFKQANKGQFVLSIPIAPELYRKARFVEGEEFTHCSYTAATTDPEDFPQRYSLRPKRFNREIKVALVITMYNEDDGLFVKTLLAVQKNIAYLCSNKCPYSWGPDGWKQFVVVIVSDGVKKINPRVETILGIFGMWLGKDFLRTSVNDEEVTAHIFELTSQIAIDRELDIRSSSEGIVPTQIIFVLKQKNAKKINSHKWFFNSVCEVISPEVVMLLDVGTKPSEKSLYEVFLF
jgi:chitin synthase